MYNKEFVISQYLADKTFRHSDKVSKLQPDNFPYTSMYLNLEMTRTDRQRIIKSFFLAYIPDRIRQISVVKSLARRPYDGRVRAPQNCLSIGPPLSLVSLWIHLHVFYQSFVNVHTPIYLFRNTRVRSRAKVFTYVHTSKKKKKVIFVFK